MMGLLRMVRLLSYMKLMSKLTLCPMRMSSPSHVMNSGRMSFMVGWSWTMLVVMPVISVMYCGIGSCGLMS